MNHLRIGVGPLLVIGWQMWAAGIAAAAAPALFIAGAECPGTADVSGFVDRQQRRVRDALGSQKLDMAVPRDRDRASVKQALKEMGGGSRLVIYAGHARVDAGGRSVVCLADGEVPIEELVRHATSGGNTPEAITFVVNACQSAAVNLAGIDVPVSVISASPYDVETDSAFAESTVQALTDSRADVNCDGRISDQELFDAIVEAPVLVRARSFRPAVPKIRRQAGGELPLPLKPRPSDACRERKAVADLVRSRPLPPALSLQLQDPFNAKVLRADSYVNYYVVDDKDGTAAANFIKWLPPELSKLNISVPEAALIARHLTSANVYKFQLTNGWLRIIRLRDGRLLATRRMVEDEVQQALPSRLKETEARGYRRRQLGRVSSLGPGWCAVPCSEEDGQCFSKDCRQ